MGKICKFIQQFQEIKIICDQVDKQFVTKKKIFLSTCLKQNILFQRNYVNLNLTYVETTRKKNLKYLPVLKLSDIYK